MSDENQKIDPALLGDDPAGLDPARAVGGMKLKEGPRGIKKINKKGLYALGGILGGAAVVATMTFNGTGSAVGNATRDAVANQAQTRPAGDRRDARWYAAVPDKVAAGEPAGPTGDATPDYLGIGAKQSGAPGAAPAPATAATGTAVPDLAGKAINPLAAATAGKTSAGVYQPGASGAAPAGGAAAVGGGAAAGGGAPDQAAMAAAQRADQAKQLQAQQLDQAMKSGLAAQGFSGQAQVGAAAAGLPGAAQGLLSGLQNPGAGAIPSLGQQQRDDDQNKQERKDQFLKAQETTADRDYSPSRKTAPRSRYELKAGWVIPAVMITGVNSDLPGQATAQVREDVYASADHRVPLIPQGSRLIGLYDAHVAYGQQRVLMAWSRVIFPDGSSFDLKGMPGADMSGYAGFLDQVDNHYTKIFGSSVLLSLISAGVQLSQPNNGGGNNNNQPSVSQTVGAALGQQIGQTAMNITQKNLNIQPTLEIRPGYRFNVMVTADMILQPVTK